MGKTLIIAEKPSVAADIVRCLPGRFTKTKTHYEGEGHIVSFALGHLVTIAYPEDIDPALQKWSFDNLPILPGEFPLAVLPDTKTQFNALKKLIKSREVDVIVNACDAGREGELIFKYILKEALGGKSPNKGIRRLWLQSMTREAIRSGLEQLRDNQEMQPLEDTALCRSEADWLIGINATRALTCYNSRFGGFRKTPCGRVQTPTLSMLVRRERERRAFVPRTFWELRGHFSCGPVSYEGLWIDPAFEKDEQNPQARKSRIWQKDRALAIVRRCSGQPATVTESSKKSSQSAPAFYDLTSLQREANNRFGFSAKNTLALAQSLYERHKLLTYPRTDSRFLPEDYLGTVKKTVESQCGWHFAAFANEALAKGYLKFDRRIFNNKKISDHFAIIPTAHVPGSLSEAELKLYQLVVQRFLAVFFPPAVYLNTTRLSLVAGEHFLTEGRILVEPGWRAIYGKSGAGEDAEQELQALPKGEAIQCGDIELAEQETKPPPRYTEATLLSAMEHSGKLVDDEELAEAMKERGLGTPATRAAIIEKLLNEKYVVREQRDLAPTGKAFELISLLEAREIDVLASPELTGEWEYKLNQILKGAMTRPQFMEEIRRMTSAIVARVKAGPRNEAPEAGFSPIGGSRFFERSDAYESEDKKLVIRKVLGGRVMREEEIAALIRGETLGPFDDFRSKRGKPFTASLRLQNSKVDFLFAGAVAEDDLDAIRAQEPVGVSPVDGTPVFETPAAYLSDSALAGDDRNGLRIAKIILGRNLEREQIAALLATGRTPLIRGFISKRKKPFDAYLLLDGKGRISFEFPPRERQPRAAGKTALAQKAETAKS